MYQIGMFDNFLEAAVKLEMRSNLPFKPSVSLIKFKLQQRQTSVIWM